MAWHVDYTGTGDVLPTADSPAWTKVATSAPTTESMSGGVLRMAQAASKNFYYTLAESSPSTYTQHEINATYRRVSGGAGRNDVCVLVAAKGAFFTQVSITSDTNVLIETFDGTTWTSDNKTVASMGSTLQQLRITHSGGVLTFYWNGSSIHTYSGTQHTAQTANQIYFGDNDAGSSSASEMYFDRVSAHFGTPDSVTATHTLTAQVVLGDETLTKVLVGEAAGTYPRVFGATDGEAYRIYDSAGAVVQSAVVSGGVAQFTSTGLPVTGGALRGFTDNTYATPIASQLWLGDIRRGNVFDADPARLGAAGIGVVDDEAADYYPTSQYGGRGQIVQTDDYWFVIYRTGGTGSEQSGGSDPDGALEIVRIDRATYAATGNMRRSIDQGPVVVRTGIQDGHEFFGIAKSGTNKIRLVYGGYYWDGAGQPLYMRETTSAEDVSAWTSATNISSGGFASGLYQMGGNYVTESDGTNHIVLNERAGGEIWHGTSTEAAPTTWTWTKLVEAPGTWGALMGDVCVNDSTGDVGFVFGSFDSGGAYDETDYQNVYFLQFDGSTLKKADGTSAGSVPRSFNSSTGAVAGADQVLSGTHYGFYCKLTFDSGVPFVLTDNQFDTASISATPGVMSVYKWNGSAWSGNAIPDLPGWGETPSIPPGDPLWDFFALIWNWGVLIGSVNGTIYVYACVGPLLNHYLDSTHDGPRMLRFRSTAASNFASYDTDVLLDDSYVPFQYGELDDGASRPAGAYGAGFCYPKVPAEDPRTVIFGAVDEEQASLLLSSLPWYVATHTLDAVVVETTAVTTTHTLDAVVLETSGTTHTLDAVVLAATSATHALDAVVLATAETTHTLDAVVAGDEIVVRPQGMVPGTVISAYRRWEWKGPVAAKLNAGPGSAVVTTTVAEDLTASFALPPGEYVAYAPAYPTKRLFFMVTE